MVLQRPNVSPMSKHLATVVRKKTQAELDSMDSNNHDNDDDKWSGTAAAMY